MLAVPYHLFFAQIIFQIPSYVNFRKKIFIQIDKSPIVRLSPLVVSSEASENREILAFEKYENACVSDTCETEKCKYYYSFFSFWSFSCCID